MTTWDAHRPFRRGQGLLVILAGIVLVPAAVATVMRVLPPRDDGTALLASFIAYGLVGYPLALMLLLTALLRARRRTALGIICLLVALATLLPVRWLGPLFVADRRPAVSATFTLLSMNVKSGGAEGAALARQAVSADVVVLVESSPPGRAALRSFGWNERFPYLLGVDDQWANNTVVYSRFPLRRSSVIESSFRQWDTIVEVPEIGDVRLLAVHPCNPFCGRGLWATEHDRLNQVAMASLAGPLVVAGDFNAVDEHGPMQELRRAGLRSATDVAGAGWLPTWPADRRFPPLLPIDHVLINDQLTATAIRTFDVAGTDHRGLIATLAAA